MEGPVAPNPANPGNNNANANQNNDNNDNNAPAGPNAPPQQSASNQQVPNQQVPNQQPPNQPAPYQTAPHQPAPANPAGQVPTEQPVPQQPPPQQPAPANPAGPFQPVPNWPQPFPHQPAPQIIHQQMINWCPFKPEFTVKPEEDAETHLLRTNDLIRTHNFDKDVKVQRFCLTLLGEAGLWYETLTPIASDWPALQITFRQQYLKLGNTPEQYFHQWRSFYFDENTDSIDSYVTKVSQCVAMLNCGEPQILELMKNTLSSRFSTIIFPMNNLRDAITTAKRVMIKEKIDRQKTGQSSTTPFMGASDNNQSSNRMSKRGVMFDAMETIERNRDSIDNLTLLVSKMNVKMDKRETQYKPRIYQGRPRGQSRNKQHTFKPCNRSFSRDRNRNRGNYNNRNNYRSNYRDRSRDNYRCNNRRNNYQSNERQINYRQDNRRDSYRQDSRRDNRDRQNCRGNGS